MILNGTDSAAVIIGFLSFLGLLTYNLYVLKWYVGIKAKYFEPTSLAADIFLWGATLEESVGLEMKTEGSCHPIPIRWQPTEVEGGLRYNVPLRAPCQKNHFKWTLNKQIVPAGSFTPNSWKLVKELTTTLEGVTEADLVDTLFTPDPVSNLRQDKKDLLRWTSSPCAEKYVVRVMGNPIQEFETATNWIQLNIPDHCEEILVEVETYSGDQGSPAVPILFNPCASEKDEDGEPASWVKASSLLSKKEQQKKPCAPFAISGPTFLVMGILAVLVVFMIIPCVVISRPTRRTVLYKLASKQN